jgi:hypothetical protein
MRQFAGTAFGLVHLKVNLSVMRCNQGAEGVHLAARDQRDQHRMAVADDALQPVEIGADAGPMAGGLIIDTNAMGEILEIGSDFVRVQAGCNILKLHEALKEKGRELPVFPSTEDIATIGGFISGGSTGIDTVSHGMLRDAGSILEIRAPSAEETPREHVFTGDRINMIDHAWGINGVITELTLRTVPTEDWIGCIATFADYPNCYGAGMALTNSDIRRKLCSTLDPRLAKTAGSSAAQRHRDEMARRQVWSWQHLGGGFRPCNQITEAGLQATVEDGGIPEKILAALLDQNRFVDDLDRHLGLGKGGPIGRGLAGNTGHARLSGWRYHKA